jgi:hypothetical protein
MQQQQQGGLRRDLNVFIGICQSLAYMGEVWLRVPGTAGCRYFSGQAAIGWILLLIIAAFGQSDFLIQFWLATGLWLVVQRVAYRVRAGRGYCPHSRFVGRSWLARRGNNQTAVCYAEPLFAFVVGFLLIQHGFEYGGFFVSLSIAMFISAAHAAAQERAQVIAMNDARATQEWLTQYSK